MRASSGSVRFEGEEILGLRAAALNRIRGSKLTMVFQDPMTSLTPHLKIGVQLAEVLVHSPRLLLARCAARRRSTMLERVRVPDPQRRLRQYPHELSGGMRQRVMIGMSLLCEPAAADRRRADQRARCDRAGADRGSAARAALRSGMAIVLISHDLGVVAGARRSHRGDVCRPSGGEMRL